MDDGVESPGFFAFFLSALLFTFTFLLSTSEPGETVGSKGSYFSPSRPFILVEPDAGKESKSSAVLRGFLSTKLVGADVRRQESDEVMSGEGGVGGDFARGPKVEAMFRLPRV